MSEQTKKVEMRPVKTIRLGAIAASIWKRQSPSGFEYIVVLQKPNGNQGHKGLDDFRVIRVRSSLNRIKLSVTRVTHMVSR